MYLQLFPIEDNFSRILYLLSGTYLIVIMGVEILKKGKKREFATHLTFLINRLVSKINSTYLTL